MANANKARATGKTSRAITEYRKILEHHPEDYVVHGRLAPLLVDAHQWKDAWKSYLVAAQGQIDNGFADRAIAVYQQAVETFPKSAKVWAAIADLQRGQGRKADAVKALLQGCEHFLARKKDHPNAIALLREVLGLEPLHVDATVALARLLKKSGEHSEARELMDRLVEGVTGPTRKTALKARFGLWPGWSTLITWLRDAG